MRGATPPVLRILAKVRRTAYLVDGVAVLAFGFGMLGVGWTAVLAGAASLALVFGRRVTLRLQPNVLRLPMRQAHLDSEASKRFGKSFRRGNARPQVSLRRPSVPAVPQGAAAHPMIAYTRSCSELVWNGKTLAVTDWRGRTLHWQTVTGGPESVFHPLPGGGTGHRPAAEIGDLLAAELALIATRSQPPELAYLLDRWSRRLATIRVLGFTEPVLAEVAQNAGIDFAVYEIPSRVSRGADSLAETLFPRSVLYRRIGGAPLEWWWLAPWRVVVRIMREA